ncbi:MAG: glycosyltransferase [Alphaproteobacteria bacterium]|nr:glycosyltransferase [Alphaproteobacteria bacterium]
MATGVFFSVAIGWWAAATLVQWTSAALGRRRPLTARRGRRAADFSIVAPMAGPRDASEDYVRNLAELAASGAEVLICVTSEHDAAVALTRRLWPEAPILVGSDTTFNPKLNNVRKGLEAASRPFVVLCDAGIALTAADLETAAMQLTDRVGLVLALKVGAAPGNFAAEMECAYINGHQARFLMAADRLGMPVASGGVTVLTRDVLDRIGGHQGFLNYLADDYSVVRTVRDRLRQQTQLAPYVLRLPVGDRHWADVWKRQVRWGSTRLNLAREVSALVLLEPVIGWLASAIALVAALAVSGVGLAWTVAALAVHTAAWLAAEAWFLAGFGLPFGPRAWAAALAREALAPLLVSQAWLGRRRIDWRGTDLAAGWPAARDGTDR